MHPDECLCVQVYVYKSMFLFIYVQKNILYIILHGHMHVLSSVVNCEAGSRDLPNAFRTCWFNPLPGPTVSIPNLKLYMKWSVYMGLTMGILVMKTIPCIVRKN